MERVGIAGLGAVGMACAKALDAGIKGLSLAAVSARDLERAGARTRDFATPPRVVGAASLHEHAGIIVECVPASAFREVALPAIDAGCTFITISVGALLSHWDLVDRAEERGARILVPSGALLGLDAVQAARLGVIDSVRMVTTKPPNGLAGAPYVEEGDIDLDALDAPTRIFSGSAREGAAAFPANVNVAAALGLAGLGPDETQLEVWADPNITRNQHEIIVESDSARMELRIQNVPSSENPRTGRIVAHSVLATLKKLTATLVIGT